MSGRKACRSIRPRKVFGKCFPKCFVHRVWYRFPIQRNCRFFFLFSSLFFFSRIRFSKEIIESLPGSQKIDVSREEREKRKTNRREKISQAHRACSKRVRTIQAGRIGAFIYSSRNSLVTRQTCKNTKIGIAFRNLVRRAY